MLALQSRPGPKHVEFTPDERADAVLLWHAVQEMHGEECIKLYDAEAADDDTDSDELPLIQKLLQKERKADHALEFWTSVLGWNPEAC